MQFTTNRAPQLWSLPLITLFVFCSAIDSVAFGQDTPTETVKAWRYQFIEDGYCADFADGKGMVDVPPTPIAEIFVSQDLKKYVCHYHVDEQNKKRSFHSEPWELVAGFDGEKYFLAFFCKIVVKKNRNDIEPSKRAEIIMVIPDKETLDAIFINKENDLPVNSWWYAKSFLHDLFFQVGIKQWARKEIQDAFENNQATRKIFGDGKYLVELDRRGQPKDNSINIPAGFITAESKNEFYQSSRYYVDAEGNKHDRHSQQSSDFEYFVEVGDNPPYILKCHRESYAFSINGPLVPAPSGTIILDQKQKDVAKGIFSYEYYADKEAEIVLPQNYRKFIDKYDNR